MDVIVKNLYNKMSEYMLKTNSSNVSDIWKIDSKHLRLRRVKDI